MATSAHSHQCHNIYPQGKIHVRRNQKLLPWHTHGEVQLSAPCPPLRDDILPLVQRVGIHEMAVEPRVGVHFAIAAVALVVDARRDEGCSRILLPALRHIDVDQRPRLDAVMSGGDRDQIIDAMVDALYEQDESEDSDRIYELERLGRNPSVLHQV